MPEKITILSPAAEAWRPSGTPIPQIADLRGATVAILNNRWTSMDIIAEQIGIILKEHYGVPDAPMVVLPRTELAEYVGPEVVRSVAREAVESVVSRLVMSAPTSVKDRSGVSE